MHSGNDSSHTISKEDALELEREISQNHESSLYPVLQEYMNANKELKQEIAKLKRELLTHRKEIR
jgi:hypothetical protein